MVEIPPLDRAPSSTNAMPDANSGAMLPGKGSASPSVGGAACNSSDRTEKQLFEEILAAFDDSIPRVRKTVGYRLGVLLVAIVMLLLPAIYIGLIGAVGFFVYWH